MQDRATQECDLSGIRGFAGEWCRPVSLFSLPLCGKQMAMDITLLENECVKLWGCGGKATAAQPYSRSALSKPYISRMETSLDGSMLTMFML